MTAAAIYCRYSTELQSATSIADQASLCRSRADALGLRVGELYADEAISGSVPIAHRPGAARMAADALGGRFAVLLVEGLDRLARNLVEQEALVRRLEHRGLRIIGVADGYDTASGKMRALARGVRGLIGETYLADLRDKTHRGLDGKVSRGFTAGGRSYGYVLERTPEGSVLRVEQSAAVVVREIFDRYGCGESCQRIAADLNARGVPGPRGTWAVAALYGSPAKGCGILNNELYIGRYVWNRSTWRKDPDTGRRQRFERPRDEWRISENPELRIVTDDAWHAVRARMDGARLTGGRAGRGREARSLFGGLLRCSSCGGAIVAIDARRYGCAKRKDRGATVCPGVTAPREAVEAGLLSMARDELLSPATIAEVGRQVEALLREQRDGLADARRRATARAAALDADIARLTDAVAQMGLSPALRARLERAEHERAALQIPASVATLLPPDWRARYAARLMRLRADLEADTATAREVLRQVFGDVRLSMRGAEVWAEIETAPAVAIAGADSLLGRVAGARYSTWKRLL